MISSLLCIFEDASIKAVETDSFVLAPFTQASNLLKSCGYCQSAQRCSNHEQLGLPGQSKKGLELGTIGRYFYTEDIFKDHKLLSSTIAA